MSTIVKFTYNPIGHLGVYGYRCSQMGDASGEYVPLVEYRALEEVSVKELVEMSKDMANLRRLVERLVELGPALHADSIADVIYGKTANTEKLMQLLKDCAAALEVN